MHEPSPHPTDTAPEGSPSAPLAPASLVAADLRDFFAAQNQQSLRVAWRLLALNDATAPKVTTDADFDQLEFSFNRLFVGPAKLQAPPYACMHMGARTHLMDQTTLAVRSVYSTLGLATPDSSTSDDHIAYELDCAIALDHALLNSTGKDARAELAALQNEFLVHHMGTWVPAFAARVLECDPHPAIAYATTRLQQWLQQVHADLDANTRSTKGGTDA